MTKHYLSVTEVAEYIGVSPSAISVYKLPNPDVTIGRTRGWNLKSIEAWHKSRPGRGNWKRSSSR